jgi:hypothetical protein
MEHKKIKGELSVDKTKQRPSFFNILFRNISQGMLPRVIIGAMICLLIGLSV